MTLSTGGYLSSRDSHGDDSMNGCVLPKVAHKPNRERRRDRAREFPPILRRTISKVSQVHRIQVSRRYSTSTSESLYSKISTLSVSATEL